MKIDRAQAIAEALSLLDEVGLDGLSTRKLAQRLGVQQPALFWHFRDKRALLDAMNAELMRHAHLRRMPLPGDSWDGFLRAYAASFRACLLSVKDGARLHAGSRAEAPDLPIAEAQLRLLVMAGFPLDAVLAALVTVSRFVVGFVLEEQAEAAHPPDFGGLDQTDHPLLSQAAAAYLNAGPDALFTRGLELVLGGLRQERVAGSA